MRHAPTVEASRAGGPWRASMLLSAPHRLCFFWAGVQWALSALWWAAFVLAQALGFAWPWQLSPSVAHGLWFGLGAMPLFIAGFLFTAGPKWLRRPPVDARGLRAAVASFTLGWVLAVAGVHVDLRLAAAGLGLAGLGLGLLAGRALRLVAGRTQRERLHAGVIAAALVVMAACLAGSSLALAWQRPQALPVLLRLGLWWGVVVVFLAASQRLLPFFGAGAWRWLDRRWPDWPLWLLASVPLVQGAVAASGVGGSLAARALLAAHLALVAAVSLRLSLRWWGEPALRQGLVRMLFVALLWWDAALCLGAAAWWPGLAPSMASRLGAAALHALTLGYLGGTMLAMVTRVSATHSGRARAIDGVARVLHALLQTAVLARVAAALWPASAWLLLPLAALAWLAVALTWALRHGRWLGQPRVDGRLG